LNACIQLHSYELIFDAMLLTVKTHLQKWPPLIFKDVSNI